MFALADASATPLCHQTTTNLALLGSLVDVDCPSHIWITGTHDGSRSLDGPWGIEELWEAATLPRETCIWCSASEFHIGVSLWEVADRGWFSESATVRMEVAWHSKYHGCSRSRAVLLALCISRQGPALVTIWD